VRNKHYFFIAIVSLLLVSHLNNDVYSAIPVMSSTSCVLFADVYETQGKTNINDLLSSADYKLAYCLGQPGVIFVSSSSLYTGSWGYLYVIYGAWAIADSTPPAAISDLRVYNQPPDVVNEGDIKLVWTAPGDDGTVGTVVSYIVKYSTVSNIENDEDFERARSIPNTPIPLPAGSTQVFLIHNLIPGVTYYFAVRAYDKGGNASSWSRRDGANQNNYGMAYDLPPPAPENLVALPDDMQVLLQWDPVEVKDLAYYNIYCDSTPAKTGDDRFLVASTTETFFVHQNLINHLTYYYWVSAVDQGPYVLESTLSRMAMVYPRPVPPNKPAHFAGIAVSTSSIVWNWADTSFSEEGFRIYTATGGIIVQLPRNTIQWQENHLAVNSASLVHSIAAFNKIGESEKTIATLYPVYTLALPPRNLVVKNARVSEVDLSWDNNNNPPYTRYGVEYSFDNFILTRIEHVTYTSGYTSSTITVDGLMSGVTYWFRVCAYNNNGIRTLYSNVVSTVTVYLTPPAKITDLHVVKVTSTTVSLEWTATGETLYTGDIVNGRYWIKYIPSAEGIKNEIDWCNAKFEISFPTNTSPGRRETVTIHNLSPSVTYSFALKLRNSGASWSEVSNTVIARTLDVIPPENVSNVKVEVDIIKREAKISWVNPTDIDFAGIIVVYSTTSFPTSITDGILLIEEGFSPGTTSYITHKGLQVFTSYYYTIFTYDKEQPRNYSSGVHVGPVYIIIGDSVPPRQVLGVNGTLRQNNKIFKLSWSPVKKDINGRECKDLAKYEIHCSSTSIFEWSSGESVILHDNVEFPVDVEASSTTWDDVYSNFKTYYYRIVAVDKYGNKSIPSLIIDNNPYQFNLYAIGSDNKSYLKIPQESRSNLYAAWNKYKEDLGVDFIKRNEINVASCYMVKIFHGDTLEEISDYKFLYPATLVLGYEVDSKGMIKGLGIPASEASSKLAIYRFNGILWEKMGGVVDTKEQVVKVDIITGGIYGIRVGETSDVPKLTGVVPKIFMPDYPDNRLNKIKFYIDNPQKVKVSAKIYNIYGAVVRNTLTVEFESNNVTILSWDGKDDAGNPVVSGVYIYQIECSPSSTFNGTVVVAK